MARPQLADSARSLTSSAGSLGTAAPSDPVDIAIQILATALALRYGKDGGEAAKPNSMLTVAQTAALLGVSRMTIIRKADSGELPCVVVSRGKSKKMRRFPRAMIETLAAQGGDGPQVDLSEFTSLWLARAHSAMDE